MRKLSGYGPSLIVLATALVVLFAGPAAVRELTYQQTRARIVQAGNRLDSNSNILASINQAYRDIAALVEPSVVHISTVREFHRNTNFGPQRAISSGSGWIYDELGHIVTNYHVVEGADRIEVQLDTGDLRDAELIGYDEFTDIAVIHIEPQRLHPAVRGDATAPVSQGDIVFAFGSPFDFRFSMSQGVVSGKDRAVGVIRNSAGQRVGFENFIQVDAAINPGNSGGPLTDYRGHVIGMNTAIATGRGTGMDEGQFAGIGLAIPLAMIEPVVSQIIEKGFVDKGFLGIEARAVDEIAGLREALSQLGFTGLGVVVQRLLPDSPTIEAGLMVRDIITHVNNSQITSMPKLQSIISSTLPGETIELRVWRADEENGQVRELTIPVTLARMDMLRARGTLPAQQDPTAIPALGIARMADATAVTARRYGTEQHAGVVIEQVVPDSRLATRLAPGSVIVAVADQPVANVREFLAALRQHNLLAFRQGNRVFGGAPVTVVQPDGAVETDIILRVEDGDR